MRSLCFALPALLAASWPASGQPEGVKAVWDVASAYRESTPTREKISVNGLWRWQPADTNAREAPGGGWGFLRVPESWPSRADGPQIFYPQPSWNLKTLGAVSAAWYQRAFAGVSPAEVHNRDPRQLPLITGGAAIVGDGVLASAENHSVVLIQLAPLQFDYSGGRINVKRTFRRVSCLTARLLGNLGAAPETPLLGRFAKPVRDGDKRWLYGLYLDVPEEWDDPYRFFRW